MIAEGSLAFNVRSAANFNERHYSKNERPGLGECLRTLRAGDTLVVWRLDRLGRSVQHLVSVVTALKEQGIGFRSLRDGPIDTTTASGVGYVPFSKVGPELFFEVGSRAYERQSLMVTTNLPFENWTADLGSERLAGALLDRLTHRVHIVEANGESYRLRQAKNRASRRSTRSHSET